MNEEDFPIYIIVGPARSGTTYLASLLSHKEVCYIEEPNIIWMYRNASAKDDCLSEANASPPIIRYIRRQFWKKLRANDCKVLLEKTPSNCLRLPFVKCVFPQARYLFVERNVNDIATSAFKKWTKEEDANTARLYGGGHKRRHILLMARRFLKVSLLDVVHYWPKLIQELSFFILGKRRRQWGPRYYGFAQDLDELSVNEICLKQARACQLAMSEFRSSLRANEFITVHYDDMKQTPDKVAAIVRNFMDLS